jgi:GNAT superfamily N-acetyltransferase
VSADAVIIRPARRSDLPAIVHLYASDDVRGSEPAGGEVAQGHAAAFEEMADDHDNRVYVAEQQGAVLGTYQLTFIRQLSYGGCLVAQVESVFVDSAHRSQGIGRRLLQHAIELARERGALRVQLTSNLKRARAHRFYERLGFRATHHGMKLYLDR